MYCEFQYKAWSMYTIHGMYYEFQYPPEPIVAMHFALKPAVNLPDLPREGPTRGTESDDDQNQGQHEEPEHHPRQRVHFTLLHMGVKAEKIKNVMTSWHEEAFRIMVGPLWWEVTRGAFQKHLWALKSKSS